MSRALRFTKAELTNAAMIAREHGVAVKLDRDGSLIVFPDKHKATAVDQPAEQASPLEKWRRQRDADKARGRAHSQENPR